MAAISPWQLETVAAFLERSREYLGIEHAIRLHWPPVRTAGRCSDAHRPRTPRKGRQTGAYRHHDHRRAGA